MNRVARRTPLGSTVLLWRGPMRNPQEYAKSASLERSVLLFYRVSREIPPTLILNIFLTNRPILKTKTVLDSPRIAILIYVHFIYFGGSLKNRPIFCM